MASAKKIHIIWYILNDYLAAALSWIVWYFARRILLAEPLYSGEHLILNQRFWAGLAMIPLGWLVFYSLVGAYRDLYKKSRLYEFTITTVCTLIGCTVLFFVIVINDPQTDYRYYYRAFFTLLLVQWLLTLMGRWFLLHLAKRQVESGKVSFNALLVGSNAIAGKVYRETNRGLRLSGFHFTGFIGTEGNGNPLMGEGLPKLGSLEDLESVIDSQDIALVVIAMGRAEKNEVGKLIERLSEKDVQIKIVPDMIDILSGSVKADNVLGAALSDIQTGLIPEWQQNIKRLIDILISLASMILLSPVMIYSAFRVAFSSPGPVIYSQERVGYKGKKFFIHKFRSMYQDAEKDGPVLSSPNDTRITPWGRIMRKWRIDELPQLWNVLKGEMSLVGPRPERQFYVDQILERSPYFRYLLKAKPGLTSWGMVQFGYAKNLDEMIERMKYDLIYIENISLGLDLKIMMHTLRTIMKGKGQ